VYARDFGDRTLTFGVSGKLIMNALVMYDRQTDSLWSQFLGVAVKGEFEGRVLEPLAATLTDWQTWRKLHPDTLVLDQGGARFDQYSGYYADASEGVLGQSFRDERLTGKEFVVGVQLEDGLKAYPFRYLNEQPVVNDTVGGIDLVVVFDTASARGSVLDRTLDGRALTFEAAPEPVEGVVAPLVDTETGTVWEGVTGLALSGPLQGRQLAQIPFTQVFWFAWSDFFPDAELWVPGMG
jgi:hypothetical protein